MSRSGSRAAPSAPGVAWPMGPHGATGCSSGRRTVAHLTRCVHPSQGPHSACLMLKPPRALSLTIEGNDSPTGLTTVSWKGNGLACSCTCACGGTWGRSGSQVAECPHQGAAYLLVVLGLSGCEGQLQLWLTVTRWLGVPGMPIVFLGVHFSSGERVWCSWGLIHSTTVTI